MRDAGRAAREDPWRTTRRIAGSRLGGLAAAVCVVGLLASPCLALDPSRDLDRLSHVSWRSRDGLPQDSVIVTAETPDGYLWIGTIGGLARFDGVRFRIFDRSNTPELLSLYIIALTTDTEGNLWIGTDGGGLVRYREGRFTHFGLEDGLPNLRIKALTAMPDGGLWIGTYGGGMARLTEGRILTDGPLFNSFSDGKLDPNIFALCTTSDGVLWIGTQSGGLGRLEGDDLEILNAEDGLAANFVWSLLCDAQDDVWVGTERGLTRVRGETLTTWGTDRGLPHPTVTALVEDHDGSLWIGTYGGGLARFREGGFNVMSSRDGLTDNSVWSLLEDRHHHLWVGTGRGLDRLTSGVVLTHLPGVPISAALEDPSGDLWVGTFDGLFRMRTDGTILDHLVPGKDLLGAPIWGLAIDGDALWIGTPAGAQRLENGILTSWTRDDGLPHNGVFAILPRTDGSVWLGTNGGIALWRDGVIEQRWTRQEGLLVDQVRMLREDSAGRLWIGTPNGLARRDGDHFDHWTTEDGLSGNMIWSIRESPGGDLWIATRGNGLTRMHGETFAVVGQKHGLPDENLCNLFFGDDGNAWMSSSRGIFRVATAELEAVADGRAESVHATLLDASDGLANSTCAGSGHLSPQAGDGRLWFPTEGGLAEIDPADLNRAGATNMPRVLIEETLNGGMSSAPPTHLVLSPENRNLEIRYTVLGSPEPRRARFRYRLRGFDTEWIDAGNRRTAFYTNLPPGDYLFEVATRDGNDAWLEPVDLTIEVEPAFHQTRLFFGLVALALGGLGFAAQRFIGLTRHSRALRAMQDEIAAKNDELERKNTELERFTYSVSHDLKGPLFTIRGFLGILGRRLDKDDPIEIDRPAVRSDLAKIDHTAEVLEQQLDALLELSRIGLVAQTMERIPLAELVDETLELLAGAVEQHAAKVRVRPDLPAVHGDRARLLAVFQNLIDNAIKYRGDGPPRLEIDAEARGEVVVCTVRDHGVGLPVGGQERIFELFGQLDSAASGHGIGLALVRRIVEVHGGTIRAESDGIGLGTRFVFTLPRARPDPGTP